jgi:hypothetical protein
MSSISDILDELDSLLPTSKQYLISNLLEEIEKVQNQINESVKEHQIDLNRLVEDYSMMFSVVERDLKSNRIYFTGSLPATEKNQKILEAHLSKHGKMKRKILNDYVI